MLTTRRIPTAKESMIIQDKSQKIKDKKRHKAGFTLIEMLVVMAVIGILASIIMFQLYRAKESAWLVKARGDVNQIRKALTLLENDANEWPGHNAMDQVGSGASGNEVWDLSAPLAGLITTDGNYNNWSGPYISAIVNDPWGHDYFFDPDYDIDPGVGERWAAVVGSFGPDGIGQNTYGGDDIIEPIIVRQ